MYLPRLNANAVPATIWFCLELIQDQKLLARVRQEVDKARIPKASDNTGAGFDLAKLCENPLLQSCFAETLRLYMNIALMRTPDRKDLLSADGDFRVTSSLFCRVAQLITMPTFGMPALQRSLIPWMSSGQTVS